MPTFKALLAAVKSVILEVSPEEARSLAQTTPTHCFLDVREPEETESGFIEGAIRIPRGFLEMRAEGPLPDKKNPVTVYCASGTRSLFAAETLGRMGYADVRSMKGGINEWKAIGLPLTVAPTFKHGQRERYSRHILLPEVGEAGQAKLLGAKVLIIGAGGLGSPAALYLAAAGVGTLGLVDFDFVDLSNLQRQILHTTSRIGALKTDSAADGIQGINPDVQVIKHPIRLDDSNVIETLRGYDAVLDGSDNFSTRYLINDAAYFLGLPVIHGSIFRFDGQVTVLFPRQGTPCYRCLFPAPPDADSDFAINCAEAGVLGVLPGVIGVIQATECLKLLLGLGRGLEGRLLVYDAIEMEFREYVIRKSPGCPLCGANPSITSVAGQEEYCAIREPITP